MWMNEWDIEDAVRDFDEEETPNLAKGAKALERLMRWTNRNSDGWPYWSKPSNAAKRLQELLTQHRQHRRSYDREDITEAALKTALRPIKAFLTRQGHNPEEILNPKPTYTMQDVWGFGSIITVQTLGDDTHEDLVGTFCKAINAAAESRSIKADVPSDALDLSRDLMIDEAVQTLGAFTWEIVDNTMRLKPAGVTIDWATVNVR